MGTHPIFESDFDCLTEIMFRYVKSKRDGVITSRDCLERNADGRRLRHNAYLGGRTRNNGQTYVLDSTRYGRVPHAHRASNSVNLIPLGPQAGNSGAGVQARKKDLLKKVSKPRKITGTKVPAAKRVTALENHRNISRVNTRQSTSAEIIVISDSESEDDDDVIYVREYVITS